MKVQNSAFGASLHRIFKCEKTADVHFVLKSKVLDVELKVPAHKAILATSPVFDRMFYGNLKEGAEVKITDVSFEAFCEFLQFFYLAEFIITEANIIEIFKLVDKYDMEDFGPVCVSLLKETVTTESLCIHYELALTYSFAEPLIDLFEKKISFETRSVFQTNSFRNINQIVLHNILEMDVWDCTEFDVFVATMSWATEACKSKSLPATPANLKAVLGKCLSLIRFPTMKPEEFAICMEKYPELIDHNVAYDILNYILVKRPLTFGQNFSKTPRMGITTEDSVSLIDESVDFNCSAIVSGSNIRFNPSENIMMTACCLLIRKTDCKDTLCCSIYLDGEVIQDFTALTPWEVVNSSNRSYRDYKQYRLKLLEPILFKKKTSVFLRVVFNSSIRGSFQYKIKPIITATNDIQFNFDSQIIFQSHNFCIEQLYFSKI